MPRQRRSSTRPRVRSSRSNIARWPLYTGRSQRLRNRHRRSRRLALSVGIVGLPNSGKTTLFRALTRTGASVPGRENVGMATLPDERLGPVAAVEGAKKVTPAALRVVDVPGTGRQPPGHLRQEDALVARP